jgi:hypothetical protein
MRGNFASKPRQEAAFARVETLLWIVGFWHSGASPRAQAKRRGPVRLCVVDWFWVAIFFSFLEIVITMKLLVGCLRFCVACNL